VAGVRAEVVWFFAVGNAAVLTFLAVSFFPDNPSPLVWSAVFCTAGSAFFCAGTLMIALRVIREPDGLPLRRLGIANRFTLVRFLLIAPILCLIAWDRYFLWIAVYLVALLTDVVDGFVARRLEERSEFGVIMDPLADVISTAALFAAFFARGWIPGWVFAILMVRYVTLYAGALVLSVRGQPLRYRATPTGKIVGVLQGATAILIGVLVWSGGGALDRFGEVIYPFLGVIFASVIISQGVIGIRHARKGTVNA